MRWIAAAASFAMLSATVEVGDGGDRYVGEGVNLRREEALVSEQTRQQQQRRLYHRASVPAP